MLGGKPSENATPAMRRRTQPRAPLPHLVTVDSLHAIAEQRGEHPVWQLSPADLRGGRRWGSAASDRLEAAQHSSAARHQATGRRPVPQLTTVERHSTLCWLMGSSATAAAYTAAAPGACWVRASSTCRWRMCEAADETLGAGQSPPCAKRTEAAVQGEQVTEGGGRRWSRCFQGSTASVSAGLVLWRSSTAPRSPQRQGWSYVR